MDEEQQRDAEAPNHDGIADSARRAGASVFGLIQTRLELIGVEVQEEKLRSLNLVVWLTVGLALGITAALLIFATLALVLWRTTGYWGLSGLAAVLVAATAVVFATIRKKIMRDPLPFATTAAEFRKDLECLKRPQ